MTKILLAIFMILLIGAVACQQAAKKETGSQTTTGTAGTGDTAVDAVGNDLNNADNGDSNRLFIFHSCPLFYFNA